MKISIISGLLVSGAFFGVKAVSLNSRTFAECGYLNAQIYCFGGDLSSSMTSFNVENKLYSLNITEYQGSSSNILNNKWLQVTSSNTFDPEERRTPEFTTLSDGKSFILVGGQNVGSTGNSNLVLANQTILYNATANTWETLPNYSETNRTERQIYYGTAVNIPSVSQDTIGFYGGFEDRSNISSPMVSVNGTIVPVSSDGTTSVRGFDSLTVFNTTSKVWSHFAPQTNIPTSFFPNSQTATLNPKTGKIYYLGGSYYTPSTGYRFPFSESYVFDTTQGSWSLVKLSAADNSIVPADRLYHSATMMPNSEDILLYGGTNDGSIAVSDFCYTLSLTTNLWTEQVNVTVPTSVSSNGARFGHSPVLVNTTLFIIFGRDINGSPSPNLLTFDVSDISNIQYISEYTLGSTNSSSSDDGDKYAGYTGIAHNYLTSGAKAGIAVGCVVGVAAIVAGALIYRRKKNGHNLISRQGQDVMHVDWDKIESQYRETQAPPVYSSQAPGSASRQMPDVYDPNGYSKAMSPSVN